MSDFRMMTHDDVKCSESCDVVSEMATLEDVFKFKFSDEPCGVVGEKVVSNRDVRSRATGCGSDSQAPALDEWARSLLNEIFPGKFPEGAALDGDNAEAIAKEILKPSS